MANASDFTLVSRPHETEGQLTAGVLLQAPFYLDRARTYQAASAVGRTDADIAADVGLSARTVRWYRRIAASPPECESLIRAYPKVFDATWAMRVARRGPLAALPSLLIEMHRHLAQRSAAKNTRAPRRSKAELAASDARARAALESLKRKMNTEQAEDLAVFARQFLQALVRSQLMEEATLNRVVETIWPT